MHKVCTCIDLELLKAPHSILKDRCHIIHFTYAPLHAHMLRNIMDASFDVIICVTWQSERPVLT